MKEVWITSKMKLAFTKLYTSSILTTDSFTTTTAARPVYDWLDLNYRVYSYYTTTRSATVQVCLHEDQFLQSPDATT